MVQLQHNRYVVALPTISPDTHEPYTTWLGVPPETVPDWVVHAI